MAAYVLLTLHRITRPHNSRGNGARSGLRWLAAAAALLATSLAAATLWWL